MKEKETATDLKGREERTLVDEEVGSIQAQLYRDILPLLSEAGVPFATGGAFAFYAYTGVFRNTKDLDIFLTPDNLKTALQVLKDNGLETVIEDELWLAKAFRGPHFVDLIFGIPGKRFQLDPCWIERSHTREILGMTLPILGIEELIASKAYLVRRNRFDGADIAHLIRCVQGKIDWKRVMEHMVKDHELLLWHLILFQFVYPGHTDYLPLSLMDKIFGHMKEGRSKPINPKSFRGMLIDPVSFAVDCEEWGYEDLRDMVPLVDTDGESL
jgi:hypothetical protein